MTKCCIRAANGSSHDESDQAFAGHCRGTTSCTWYLHPRSTKGNMLLYCLRTHGGCVRDVLF
jgi:hypothetical protein